MLCCPSEFSLDTHMSNPGIAGMIRVSELANFGLLRTQGTLDRIEENMENRREKMYKKWKLKAIKTKTEWKVVVAIFSERLDGIFLLGLSEIPLC